MVPPNLCEAKDLHKLTNSSSDTSSRSSLALLFIVLTPVQGNGHARDKLHFEDKDLYILDIYNADLWPWDSFAKGAIDCELPIRSGTGDEDYLSTLKQGLERAFKEFTPDIILYNAGTDILVGDPLGRLVASPYMRVIWQSMLCLLPPPDVAEHCCCL